MVFNTRIIIIIIIYKYNSIFLALQVYGNILWFRSGNMGMGATQSILKES
jgi:hypothetical protein